MRLPTKAHSDIGGGLAKLLFVCTCLLTALNERVKACYVCGTIFEVVQHWNVVPSCI